MAFALAPVGSFLLLDTNTQELLSVETYYLRKFWYDPSSQIQKKKFVWPRNYVRIKYLTFFLVTSMPTFAENGKGTISNEPLLL
jgi:hypothetical protein